MIKYIEVHDFPLPSAIEILSLDSYYSRDLVGKRELDVIWYAIAQKYM